MSNSPDPVFADSQLAELYDPLDPDRSDLEVYAAIVAEFGARRVLDIGCGTGTFAVMLAARGTDVIGLDPAAASVVVARGKPGADRVSWIVGDVTALPDVEVDLVTMTANVAQAIVDPDDWSRTLAAAYDALTAGGRLVFETRDPRRRAWEEWVREASEAVTDVPGFGPVRTWYDLLDVSGPLVTFRITFVYGDSGDTRTSVSTLRFRTRDEVAADLDQAGFTVDDVRGAPDRPGREMVFIARKPG